jgi:hypothetical protein
VYFVVDFACHMLCSSSLSQMPSKIIGSQGGLMEQYIST